MGHPGSDVKVAAPDTIVQASFHARVLDGDDSRASPVAMTLDPQARAWLDAGRASGMRPYQELGVEEARRLVDGNAVELFGGLEAVARVEDVGPRWGARPGVRAGGRRRRRARLAARRWLGDRLARIA